MSMSQREGARMAQEVEQQKQIDQKSLKEGKETNESVNDTKDATDSNRLEDQELDYQKRRLDEESGGKEGADDEADEREEKAEETQKPAIETADGETPDGHIDFLA